VPGLVRRVLSRAAGYRPDHRPGRPDRQGGRARHQAVRRPAAQARFRRRALIGDPELIFLDEPTTGFDPSARRAAWQVVAGLRQLGKTVFLTTHYLDEAEYLADRITVLSAGRIVAEGTPQTLGGRDRMATTITFTLPDHVQARDLPPRLSPLTEPGPGGSTVMHSDSPLVHLQMLGNWAAGGGFDLADLDVHRPTLEEVYLSLTGAASTKDQR
jgi:ABC-2 type transport system ATP-binding protein